MNELGGYYELGMKEAEVVVVLDRWLAVCLFCLGLCCMDGCEW